MAEAIKISTGKYTKEGKVEVDGKLWTVKLPGAGSEMRLSQAFRLSKSSSARLKLLDEKIDAGTATEQDLDRYDEYSEQFQKNEELIMELSLNIFKDGTPDNSEVRRWINDTPAAIIQMAFDDIQQAAEEKDKDGQQDSAESS